MDLRSLLSNSIRAAADRVFGKSENRYSDIVSGKNAKSQTIQGLYDSSGSTAVASVSREMTNSLKSLMQPIALPAIANPGSDVNAKRFQQNQSQGNQDVQEWAFGDESQKRNGSIGDDAKTLGSLSDSVADVGRTAANAVAGVATRASAADKSIQSLAKSAESLAGKVNRNRQQPSGDSPTSSGRRNDSDSRTSIASSVSSWFMSQLNKVFGVTNPIQNEQTKSAPTIASAAKTLSQSAASSPANITAVRNTTALPKQAEKQDDQQQSSLRPESKFDRFIGRIDSWLKNVGEKPKRDARNKITGRTESPAFARKTVRSLAVQARRSLRRSFPGRTTRVVMNAGTQPNALPANQSASSSSGLFRFIRMFGGNGGNGANLPPSTSNAGSGGSGAANASGSSGSGGSGAGPVPPTGSGGGAVTGMVLTGVVILAFVAAVISATKALINFGKQGYETALRVAEYNGALASAKAQLEVGRLMRDIKTSNNLSENGAEFIKSLNELEEALRPITDFLQSAGLAVLTILTDMATKIIQAMNKVADVLENPDVQNVGNIMQVGAGALNPAAGVVGMLGFLANMNQQNQQAAAQPAPIQVPLNVFGNPLPNVQPPAVPAPRALIPPIGNKNGGIP